MEAIRERLMHLETLIGPDEEGKERSVIDHLREAMESAESLYISLATESSERLAAAEETIAILKRAVTNSPIRVSTSKPKVPKPKVGQEVPKNLRISCGT
jgi:hypothetical protein